VCSGEQIYSCAGQRNAEKLGQAPKGFESAVPDFHLSNVISTLDRLFSCKEQNRKGIKGKAIPVTGREDP
jgi:hypothetical protein